VGERRARCIKLGSRKKNHWASNSRASKNGPDEKERTVIGRARKTLKNCLRNASRTVSRNLRGGDGGSKVHTGKVSAGKNVGGWGVFLLLVISWGVDTLTKEGSRGDQDYKK